MFLFFIDDLAKTIERNKLKFADHLKIKVDNIIPLRELFSKGFDSKLSFAEQISESLVRCESEYGSLN